MRTWISYSCFRSCLNFPELPLPFCLPTVPRFFITHKIVAVHLQQQSFHNFPVNCVNWNWIAVGPERLRGIFGDKQWYRLYCVRICSTCLATTALKAYCNHLCYRNLIYSIFSLFLAKQKSWHSSTSAKSSLLTSKHYKLSVQSYLNILSPDFHLLSAWHMYLCHKMHHCTERILEHELHNLKSKTCSSWTPEMHRWQWAAIQLSMKNNLGGLYQWSDDPKNILHIDIPHLLELL